jgi:hypothetical protein
MYAAPGYGLSLARLTRKLHLRGKKGALTKLDQQTNSYASNDGPPSSVERVIAYLLNFLVG